MVVTIVEALALPWMEVWRMIQEEAKKEGFYLIHLNPGEMALRKGDRESVAVPFPVLAARPIKQHREGD